MGMPNIHDLFYREIATEEQILEFEYIGSKAKISWEDGLENLTLTG